MNTLLWVVQIAGALLFAASGIMKLFMFDKISHRPILRRTASRRMEESGSVGIAVSSRLDYPNSLQLAPHAVCLCSPIFRTRESALYLGTREIPRTTTDFV